jgi:F-type H+-transporting ATPase subunit epsilon
MEVQPHVVTILADSATRATDIDEAAVLEAKRNAELLLSNNKGDIDSAAAMAALAESVAQIQTLNKLKNKA